MMYKYYEQVLHNLIDIVNKILAIIMYGATYSNGMHNLFYECDVF